MKKRKPLKRREFMQAALAGMAALTLVPVPAKAVPFSEVFQPAGPWEDFAYGDEIRGQEMDLICHDEMVNVTSLDGIFKRLYSGKIKSCYPTPFGFTPSFDSKGPAFSQPIKLKFENGFTHAD
jgi:hypothetical protein